MFPFLQWSMSYNTQWLVRDLVAGITVGAVVIPQSMAYAELAKPPLEYARGRDVYTSRLDPHQSPSSSPREAWEEPGDRPWNDPGPTRAERRLLRAQEPPTTPLATLRAVILDFSAVNNVDVTSCQPLIDVRDQLDRWASPNRVQWHSAHVNNKWTRRALAAAEIVGDGTLPISSAQSQIFGSKVEWTKDPETGIKVHENRANISIIGATDDDIHVIETGTETVQSPRRCGKSSSSPGITVVDSITRPHFHVDLTSALQSAMSNS
ncbi:uncharacterized protein N7446_006090 [Penicillium canescens]|uniref:SLC26A/SulP transporter domain-containing protein n=1 Tax=Penicillium canescens TaxID=5083 RepID=A0AAD6IJL7_PENCN|nr:uncharacterized protein N7446_006090 [Penicillium canescens]KAJ6051458.1 hypothetical protein N7460_001992 [Penicillium canescens]KAJ6061970.1 hypothetical protein N7446_006090 [Penicillium canescens]KAJ6065220.1 hypothetical protein N7444_000873 [Penicillium canescens]